MSATIRSLISLTAAGAVLIPGIAAAAVAGLPDHGPIPPQRPAAEIAAATDPLPVVHRDVVQISTTAQPIPAERLDVRVVGARFLPNASEEYDITAPRDTGIGVVDYAGQIFADVVATIFDDEPDADVQVAAVAE